MRWVKHDLNDAHVTDTGGWGSTSTGVTPPKAAVTLQKLTDLCNAAKGEFVPIAAVVICRLTHCPNGSS